MPGLRRAQSGPRSPLAQCDAAFSPFHRNPQRLGSSQGPPVSGRPLPALCWPRAHGHVLQLVSHRMLIHHAAGCGKCQNDVSARIRARPPTPAAGESLRRTEEGGKALAKEGQGLASVSAPLGLPCHMHAHACIHAQNIHVHACEGPAYVHICAHSHGHARAHVSQDMHVHTCTSTRAYTHVHRHAQAHACIQMHIQVCIITRACTQACTSTHAHWYLQTHIHTSIHTCTQVCTSRHAHMCTQTYTHVCTSTHMHTCTCTEVCMITHAHEQTGARACTHPS